MVTSDLIQTLSPSHVPLFFLPPMDHRISVNPSYVNILSTCSHGPPRLKPVGLQPRVGQDRRRSSPRLCNRFGDKAGCRIVESPRSHYILQSLGLSWISFPQRGKVRNSGPHKYLERRNQISPFLPSLSSPSSITSLPTSAPISGPAHPLRPLSLPIPSSLS